MSRFYAPADPALKLAQAFRSGEWFDALAPAEVPASLDEAYDVQKALQRELGFHGFGWKVAAASVNALRVSPSGRPIFGLLWRECRLPHGATIALPASGALTFEVEVAVRFAREARPSQTAFDPSLIDGVFVAFEIVRSRFVDRKVVGQPSFVADDAGFHAFVLGEQIAERLEGGAFQPLARLRHDGVELVGPMSADDGTEVLASLRHFWTWAAGRDVVVPAGAIVTTGTQTLPKDTREPGVYEGEIAGRTVRLVVG